MTEEGALEVSGTAEPTFTLSCTVALAESWITTVALPVLTPLTLKMVAPAAEVRAEIPALEAFVKSLHPLAAAQ